MGKGKVDYSPHVEQGDSVIVINAEKVRVTGKKGENKVYKTFSGYPGGLKEHSYEYVMKHKPTEIIRHAVKGMVPKNILGTHMMKRLYIYCGGEHPHAAQKPISWTEN